METLENIRIEGRTGTWYEIDRNDRYILFESEEYGDEAGHILTDYDLQEVCETWDSLEETVDYLEDTEPSWDCDEGFDPYMGCYTGDC